MYIRGLIPVELQDITVISKKINEGQPLYIRMIIEEKFKVTEQCNLYNEVQISS